MSVVRHSGGLIARLLAVTGLALAGVAAATVPASAEAGQQAAAAAGTVVVATGDGVFPPAPSAAETASLAAVSPTISPVLARTRIYHANPGDPFPCASGYLCTGVWDPTTGNWKAFDLYECRRYSLSNWFGEGHWKNNQTGGVTSTLYGQSGNVLLQFTPDYPTLHIYNWDPVWSIRNC